MCAGTSGTTGHLTHLPAPEGLALRVDALGRPEPLGESEAFAPAPQARPEEGRAELRLVR
ncbi:hypothetical protein [Streptomyces hydrogenans]|uniref:hypothetical protein n=1 Tax=Streptomyces hydrogenans TaxID=1873719 RepID=UPI00380E595D